MGKNLSHKKLQYSYSKEMFPDRAKLIWIIGDSDKRSSTVFFSLIAIGCCR